MKKRGGEVCWVVTNVLPVETVATRIKMDWSNQRSF